MTARSQRTSMVLATAPHAIPTQALYIALIAAAVLSIGLLLARTRRLRDESMLANDRAAGARDLRGYALALLDAGYDDSATDVVRAYLDRIPGDAGFRALLGALAARRGDAPEAVVHLEHAIRLLGPDGQRPPVQRQRLAYASAATLSNMLRSSGRAAEADRYLQMARALPAVPSTHDQPGDPRVILETVRDDDAEQGVFERLFAWEERPPLPRAPGFADPRVALRFFRVAARRRQPSARLMCDRALAEEAAGQVAQAERTLRRALRASPRDPWLLHALGEFQWRGGRLEECLGAFGEALEVAPGNSGTAAACAVAHMRLGRLDDAAGLLHRAMQHRPDISLLPVLFGQVALRLGRAPEAEAAFARAEQLGANDARFQTAYADTLAAVGKAQPAEARYKLAARADGPRGLALAHYGEFLFARKRYQEADEALSQALHMDGGEEAPLTLARLDLMLGRPDQLQEHVQAAVNSGLRQAEARQLQARMLLMSEKYEEAAGVASRLVELDVRDPEVYLILGQALQQVGRRDEGRAALTEATRRDARLAETRLAEARSLFEQGYLFGARVAAADALALRPDWPAAREGFDRIVQEFVSQPARRRGVTAAPRFDVAGEAKP